MNLPNKLTMLRVILVPVFMVFAALCRYGTQDFNAGLMLAAGIVFAVASFTDFLDGYLARKNNLVTDFGKFMDPLADKCLTTAAFLYMLADGVCHPVVLAVILSVSSPWPVCGCSLPRPALSSPPTCGARSRRFCRC